MVRCRQVLGGGRELLPRVQLSLLDPLLAWARDNGLPIDARIASALAGGEEEARARPPLHKRTSRERLNVEYVNGHLGRVAAAASALQVRFG